MKKYILSIFIFASIQAISQEVLISHPSYATTHLAMNGDAKGFHLPNVALEDAMSTTPFDNITEGLMVYNSNPHILNGNGTGIYIYIGNKWIRSGENADHYLIKDYKQNSVIKFSVRPVTDVKEVLTIAGNTFTLQGECEQRSSEEYTRKFCLYTATSSVDWKTAFNLSRNNEIDGFLPVVTSETEQQNLKAFLELKGVSSNIWLGTRKVNYVNSATVENSNITPYYTNLIAQTVGMDWSNRPKKYHNFLELEPNNNNRSEGCMLMLGAGLGTTSTGVVLEKGKWIDTSCTTTNFIGESPSVPNAGEIKNIIVEIGY